VLTKGLAKFQLLVGFCFWLKSKNSGHIIGDIYSMNYYIYQKLKQVNSRSGQPCFAGDIASPDNFHYVALISEL
jgi:hypothetical protein